MCSTELYFRCGFRPTRKRRHENSLEMTADSLFSRRRLSNQSTKFHRRGCFLFTAVERAERGKERNRKFGKRERDVYANSTRTKRLEAQRETCRTRENRWREKWTGDREETTISLWWLIGHHHQPRRWFAVLTDAVRRSGVSYCDQLENRSSVPTTPTGPVGLRLLIGCYICNII